MDRSFFVINIFIDVKILSFFWSLFIITASTSTEVFYNKHTGTGVIKALECTIQYMDVQYGVVKVSDDGTSCDHETWSWFDTHSPEAGHTYYIKDKMKISFDPPIHLVATASAEATHSLTLPSPMSAGKSVSVYFTPTLPFTQMFLDLRGNGHYISHFAFWYEDNELRLLARTNGVWQNPSITSVFPFTSEKVYKVTLLATTTEIEAYIDDVLMLTMDQDQPISEAQTLLFAVAKSATSEEAVLHRIDLYMD